MPLTLRLKKGVILLLTASLVSGLLLVGASTVQSLREIRELWHAHSDEATLHLSEVNQIRHHFGYGGFTHHFKNYLLERNEVDRRRAEASLVRLMESLSQAEKLHLTPLERLAIADIRRTAELYRERFLHARVLLQAGEPLEQITPSVRLDDSGAVKAFRLLSRLAVEREAKAETAADERVQRAIRITLWGALVIPLVLFVAFLLWRFVVQVVKANTALEAVTQELDAILANAPDAMLNVAADGRIVRVNEQAENLFGYAADELVGLKVERLMPEAIRGEHVQLRDSFMRDNRHGHRVASGRELVALTRDGRQVPVEIGLSVLQQGEHSRAIATIRDVTERRRDQQRIEQLNASLKQQNSELESFSYSVSHDLRTPLRSIEGFSQLLERRYSDKLDTTGVDYLQRIRRATLRMGHLIDDLLQLSRVSRTEIKQTYLDLSTMATEILQGFADTEPGRQVRWEVDSGLHGVADPGLMRIVLENLLGNAWKYSSEREVATIRFSAFEQDGNTVYFVCDNGVGFDMGYVDKIFGAFERLHGPEEFEGTGIGLSTVERIIHRHHGRIWAQSKPGEGSCFYFTLGKGREYLVESA